MPKQITLNNGLIVIVDDADFESLTQRKWSFVSGYARRSVSIGNGKFKRIYMHRLLMGDPQGMLVDHINGNGLDNRRCNLRLATKSQNAANSKKPGCKFSKYKGVGRQHRSDKWVAAITVHDKLIHLGSFENEKEAAQAYNTAAQMYFGSYALLNEVAP